MGLRLTVILGLVCGLVFPTFLVLVPSKASAHGGGLDAQGCHHDRKRGGYHCHRAPTVGGGRSAPKASFTSGRAFANCSAARAAGAAPVYRGDPGYASHLDRDNDGVGCETGGGSGVSRSGRALSPARNLPKSATGLLVDPGALIPAPRSGLRSVPTDAALDGLSAEEQLGVVARIQQALADGGFDPGAVDGRFGARTRAALGRFQTQMSLPSTGYLDAATLDTLGVVKAADAADAAGSSSVDWNGETISDPVWIARPGRDDQIRYYPDRAQRLGVTGEASVSCVVTAKGTLQACEVTFETPEDVGFGDAALRMTKLFRLQLKSGQAGGRVLIPFVFDLPR